MKGQKGFTLIELLVVIAIIGILAAIAIPQFSKYRERAAKASAISDAKNIANSIEAYYADYQSYPSSISGSTQIIIGQETFDLSKNNQFQGYGLDGNTAYHFTVSNTVYGKAIYYNSNNGGLDASGWQ